MSVSICFVVNLTKWRLVWLNCSKLLSGATPKQYVQLKPAVSKKKLSQWQHCVALGSCVLSLKHFVHFRPMFEEDVPSVLELEMEELDQWMKKDGRFL